MTVARVVSIVGAGTAGLVLGRCLLQRGVRAVVFEKARASPHRNDYGITLHSQSYRPLLHLLGIEESAFRQNTAVDGAIGGTGRLNVDSDNDASIRVNRRRFEALLAEGLDIRWEHEVDTIKISSGLAPSIMLTNSSQHESDIVVGADGPHSRVRQTVLPDSDFKILPYAVYNGKRRLKAIDFDSKLGPYFAGTNVLEHKINNTIFQISINHRTSEDVNLSYTYSRPPRPGKEAEEDPLYRPSRSKDAAKEMPEELFDEIRSYDLAAPFSTIFDSDAMRDDRLLNWLMRSLRVEREALDHAAENGVVLVGDAAHAEPILGGYGANEAIEDGMLLAEILASGDSRLADFYDWRYDAWQRSVEESEKRIAGMHGVAKANL